MNQKKVKSIIISGCRWFDKTYGNTYHGVTVYVDNDFLAVSKECYGYDEQYIQTAWEMLKKNNIVTGSYGDFLADRRKNKDKYNITVFDARTHKELKNFIKE